MVDQVLFSHKSDDYITPQWLIDELKNDFNIVLDPCTSRDNPLDIKWVIYPPANGLKYPWRTWTFCNPPYSQARHWVQKARCEQIGRSIKSILLLPARTDTAWFHEYLYNKPDVQLRFLKSRLKFQGTKHSAPFPSMLAILW